MATEGFFNGLLAPPRLDCAAMFGIGPVEFAVVLVLALLIMGPKKLPELARTLGRGMAEFRRASNELRRSIDMDLPDHKIERPPGPAQAGLTDEPKKKLEKKNGEKDEKPEAAAGEAVDDESHTDSSSESVPVDTSPPAPRVEEAPRPDQAPQTNQEPRPDQMPLPSEGPAATQETGEPPKPKQPETPGD